MATKRKMTIPKFTSEAEDSRWHQKHKRRLESEMGRRIQDGTALSLREAVSRIKSRPVTIRLATDDIAAARSLAARKGIGYQTYIKMLLREALQREAGRR